MTVSVIIPTWNGWNHLARCLASLRTQVSRPDEILVVDNGSTDGTADRLAAEYPEARIVRSAVNRGFAGGVNIGAAQAHGDVLWILNDDVVLDPRCLAELLARIGAPDAPAACSAKVLRLELSGDGRPARFDALGDYLTWTGFLLHVGYGEPDRGQYDRMTELFSPKGVCFLVRRSMFEAMGRFDDTFVSYFEESDLFWRCWLAGHRVGFAPAARVRHEGGGTSRRLPATVIDAYSFRNRLTTLLTHLGAWRLSIILPIHLALCGIISLAYAIRGQFRHAAAVLAALGRTFGSLPAVLAKRRRVQALRRVPDREIFRQHARAIPIGHGWQFLRVYLKRW